VVAGSIPARPTFARHSFSDGGLSHYMGSCHRGSLTPSLNPATGGILYARLGASLAPGFDWKWCVFDR